MAATAASGRSRPLTGCAKVTRGYNLPAAFVLHTVGPIAQGAHNRSNAKALASCFEACLECARELGTVRSIAFCSISTGVFGYPKEPACQIAVATVRRWLREHRGACERIVFNVFSSDDHAVYEQVLTSSSQNPSVR